MKQVVSTVDWKPTVRASCQKSAHYRKLSTENEVSNSIVVLVIVYRVACTLEIIFEIFLICQLYAVSKGMRAVKLCANNILQFLT